MSNFDVNIFQEDFYFVTDSGLFSPNQLDVGSRLLLDEVIKADIGKSILDIGCGYGAMGIILAKKLPNSQITMIDNDPKAVTLTKENAAKNKTPNVRVVKIDVTRQTINGLFETAITNPPWSKNKSVTPKLVQFAFNHLAPKGRLYMVINQTFKAETAIGTLFKNVAVISSQEPYKIITGTKPESL